MLDRGRPLLGMVLFRSSDISWQVKSTPATAGPSVAVGGLLSESEPIGITLSLVAARKRPTGTLAKLAIVPDADRTDDMAVARLGEELGRISARVPGVLRLGQHRGEFLVGPRTLDDVVQNAVLKIEIHVMR